MNTTTTQTGKKTLRDKYYYCWEGVHIDKYVHMWVNAINYKGGIKGGLLL